MPLWFSNLVSWSAQVALLVLVAGLLLRVFRIRDPRALVAFYRGLLLLTLLLPLLQPWHRLPNVASAAVLPDSATLNFTAQPPAAVPWRFPSLPVIADGIGIAIVVGIALRFMLLALGLLRLHRFRETSVPITSADPSAAILNAMLAKIGAKAHFRISANVDSPVTFGLRDPVVLLPKSFPSTEARVQSVVACHELLHTRRRDWAQHLIEEIVRAVFWFHPAILWLISRTRLTREQLVDVEVVRLTNAREAYLDALLEFARRQTPLLAVPASLFLAQHQLVERISLILKEAHMSRRKLIASLAVTACCLALVLGLSAWRFPLKRAPLQSASATSDSAVAGGVAGGVVEGVVGGVIGGVTDGVTPGVVAGVLGVHTSSAIPQVDASSIWIDTVAKGPLVRQVRGLGKLVRTGGSTNLVAQITVPAFLTAEVKPGQNASVASRKGPLANGHVTDVGPSGSADTRTIDIALDTAPQGADANLEIDGTIDIEKLDDVLHVGRPVHGTANTEISLFKLDNDGTDATRIKVKLGRASVNSIEILAGLKEGDRIILSDLSQVGNADHIHITDSNHSH